MKYEIYSDFVAAQDLRVFEFVSLVKRGFIRKSIAFIPTEIPNIYNLAFGDVNEEGEIDDCSISDNGDRNKILATLAKVIEIYTDKYPERLIYFRGSTSERTRLYRMAIGLNLDELSVKFDIFGEIDDGQEYNLFHKNMEISAFLIRRKNA
jgi:hypothetical protein